MCITIIIKVKEVINLRVGERTWGRSEGEDLKGVEKREEESDGDIF